jgi:hypothetical protein
MVNYKFFFNMNTEKEKLEIINWVLNLEDINTLMQVMELKNKNNKSIKKRKFGGGKGIFTYISDDFNEPF